MFYRDNEGQDHGVQQSQWFHSSADVNLYKRARAFFAGFHRFQNIHISNFATLKFQVKVMMYNICSMMFNVCIFLADTCQKVN